MHIKSTFGGALVGALVLAGTIAAQASTVWSTGEVTSDGLDQKYSVVGFAANNFTNSNTPFSATPPSYTAGAATNAVVYTNPAYASGLTFVSTAENGGAGLNTTVYQVTFNLDVASTISGLWAADNGAAIYNNNTFLTGLPTISNGPDTNYASTHPFSFMLGAGSQVLNFFVTDGGPPSAFAFNVQSVVASAVPGPVLGAGLPGLIMAVGGFFAMRRRRAAMAA